ncbi:MAG: hypothetical protein B6D65_04595 [candidate division Zixibacteria bacterium 4484_93]|nr:MAG: hypothetical protein B6D65_04595 [candidate division Zixibacteria bacterium 4484_93]
MKTYIPKVDSLQKRWYVVDASGKTLGRLATQIAKIIRGKNKPIYTPHLDTGDYVIVVNRGMLPKNRLGRKLARHLFVYTGKKHPHQAQKPEKIDI